MYADLDGFFLDAMLALVENIDLDAIPGGERAADLRVAVEIAGDYMSDEWRAQAVDVGLLSAA